MPTNTDKIVQVEKTKIVMRFAGDAGDGIQTIGALMTLACAQSQNNVHTIADFPSDMRSPQGSLFGVSAFGLCFASEKIYTAGDTLDCLVALNPAALKTNIKALDKNSILLVDSDKFTDADLKKAEYDYDPLTAIDVENFKVISVPISSSVLTALKDIDMPSVLKKRCKNFFVLGISCFLFNKKIESIKEWIKNKFKDKDVVKANLTALNTGFSYFYSSKKEKNNLLETYRIKPAKLKSGKYKLITGNQAFSYGLLSLAAQTKQNVFLASYPITPATDIFSELTKYKNSGVTTFQAEDEIAALCAVIGAAYGGKPALTCSSGPGIDLMVEAMGLAVIAELPLVVLNVQRAGPSTGMPTKTEQSDLLSAMYSRHGEAPLVVMAAKSPSDCYNTVIEAYKIALKYMTPVIVLSDSNIANCQEPWLIPDVDNLPEIKMNYAKLETNNKFKPYKRDEKTLARNYAIPGTKGLEHIIGGLEKKNIEGDVSYEAENHQLMSDLRKQKIENVTSDIPKTQIEGKNKGKLLVITWGSVYGAAFSAINEFKSENTESKDVSYCNLKYLNPLPKDLFEIMLDFENILVVENNLGQLNQILAAQLYLYVNAKQKANNSIPMPKFHFLNQITGVPFKILDIKDKILNVLNIE